MLLEILLLFVLVVVNAFFAASEIALISLNDNKVKKQAEAGDKKAVLLDKLLSEPSRFLATIQIGITLAGFLASAFAAESFAGRLAEVLYQMGVPFPKDLLGTISVIIITIVLSYFTLVLGELVPKRLALKKAEGIANFAVTPLTMLSKISSPFVKLLTFSMNIIVKLFGVDPNEESKGVTEEEIRMMVDVGKERGTIQEAEKMMINNVFEFDNKTVSEIMTHRIHIVAIPVESTLNETVQVINQGKFTRFPVYEEDIDNIIGILHAKELIQFLGSTDQDKFDLKKLIREPLFVIESKKIDELFKDMQKHNIHMAVVIDEYGGTDGVVTMEDAVEEIVGNINDEYDEPYKLEKEIVLIDEKTYIIAGSASLHEVEKALHIPFPTDEYETLSGFLIGRLGYIPVDEQKLQSIEYEDILFSVLKASERRIIQVRATIQKKK
ncbi:HlyC/CorC family transporter [Bacillaceae bacterium Marseille-Q3522]|nr:HlyC/CorC family transporter [Bacillaceae bacterium Marseille-Q3522]